MCDSSAGADHSTVCVVSTPVQPATVRACRLRLTMGCVGRYQSHSTSVLQRPRTSSGERMARSSRSKARPCSVCSQLHGRTVHLTPSEASLLAPQPSAATSATQSANRNPYTVAVPPPPANQQFSQCIDCHNYGHRYAGFQQGLRALTPKSAVVHTAHRAANARYPTGRKNPSTSVRSPWPAPLSSPRYSM